MEARARRMAFRSGALSEVRRAEADRHLKVICWRRQGSVQRSRWPILIVKVVIEMWMPSPRAPGSVIILDWESLAPAAHGSAAVAASPTF